MANLPSLGSRNEFIKPLRAMNQMQRQIDRMFDDFFRSSWSGDWNVELPAIPEGGFQPPCDVQETDTHYLMSFDLPGMSKNDVKIELQDSTLRVFGERKDERKEGRGQNVRTERYHGTIERVLTLPANIKSDAIEAQFENGVLHVAVPKVEAAKPKQIQVAEGKPGFISKLLGKKEEKAA